MGRGRPFWGFLAPRLAEAFGTGCRRGFGRVLPRSHRVAPSPIRVEADEVTYALHILLRFELEQELFEGKLAIRDLPEAWNARDELYLGVEVPDDAQGVLQDVHWAAGLIGYFPTYALGNLIAGQLFEAPAPTGRTSTRTLRPATSRMLDWLREPVHRHGAKFSTSELLDRLVGGPIAVGPFVDYLKAKLGQVYDVQLR